MRLHELVERLNTGTDLQLTESILVPEVDAAFKEWVNNAQCDWMLIGGLVVGYYTKPRTTMVVDVLFGSEMSIPTTVAGFKKHRGHAFQHNATHVEIEVLSPEYLNMDKQLYDEVFDTSIVENGVRIPSAAGLICLKLGRSSPQDLADIYAIVSKHSTVNIAGYSVKEELILNAESKLGIKLNR
jgi:hypothetical protein